MSRTFLGSNSARQIGHDLSVRISTQPLHVTWPQGRAVERPCPRRSRQTGHSAIASISLMLLGCAERKLGSGMGGNTM